MTKMTKPMRITLAIAVLAALAVLYTTTFLKRTDEKEPLFTRVPSVASAPEHKAPEGSPPEESNVASAVRHETIVVTPQDSKVRSAGAVAQSAPKAASGTEGDGSAKASAAMREAEAQQQVRAATDSYISNMYTDEKLKATIPELAAVLHGQLNREQPDAKWSAEVQQLLGTYFDQSLKDFQPKIYLTRLECRSSTCEIVGAVPGPESESTSLAIQKWAISSNQLRDQPWWSGYGLGDPQSEIAFGEKGELLLFLFFTRAQG